MFLLTQRRLKSQIIIKEIQTLLILGILTTLVIMAVPSVLAVSTMPGNHTDSSAGAGNMTFVGNMTGGRSMMMPGGNMTFGASLQNAKMHLTEAIMDLKTGNTREAMMELNLTDQGIKMHEQEMKSMMMELKNVMAHER
jgi:hypothetical protein